MIGAKPYAPAAERNQQAILSVLQKILSANDTVFEFGSGTGQHACYIAAAMPQIIWQPSDLEDKISGIEQWIAESGCRNILAPVQLDISDAQLAQFDVSVCFSANTLHIISWMLVEKLFELAASYLTDGGKLCVYGPFIFDGRHVSDSNRQFDQQLRTSEPSSGIRDVVQLQNVAIKCGFSQVQVFDMPANNHLLVWELDAQASSA